MSNRRSKSYSMSNHLQNRKVSNRRKNYLLYQPRLRLKNLLNLYQNIQSLLHHLLQGHRPSLQPFHLHLHHQSHNNIHLLTNILTPKIINNDMTLEIMGQNRPSLHQTALIEVLASQSTNMDIPLPPPTLHFHPLQFQQPIH